MGWTGSPADIRAKRRARNAARRAKGLCINCPMPSPRFWKCQFCRLDIAERHRAWQKAYHQRHRDRVRERNRACYYRRREAVNARKRERRAA